MQVDIFMDKKQRIECLIELWSQIKPDDGLEVNEFTKINNAEIQNICMYEGAAFFRVKNWLESTIGEKRQKELKGELDIDGDVKKFRDVLNECATTMRGRMEKYGNSWRTMKIENIAALILMKMDRISELGSDNAKTKDELIDAINYCTFALIKFNEKKND